METEDQLIARAEKWAAAKKEHPEQRHSPADYIAEFAALGEYIDRSREMHPYVQAYFFELIIDAMTTVIQVMTPPPEREGHKTEVHHRGKR
jgi:hypothetical protein